MIPFTDSINQFTYNGVKSFDDMSMIIKARPTVTTTRRRITPTSVPGRTGDILIDDEGFENYDRTYSVAIIAENEPLEVLINKIKRWLFANVNYYKLEDTYDSRYFYKAFVNNAVEITPITHNLAEAEITFNCKAYKYAKDGLQSTARTAAGDLVNHEAFTALPIIQIFGSGEVTLYINNRSYYIKSCTDGMILNSEIGQAYSADETTLLNNNIKFTDFPVLDSGHNNILWTGNVTKIIITPNWRSL